MKSDFFSGSELEGNSKTGQDTDDNDNFLSYIIQPYFTLPYMTDTIAFSQITMLHMSLNATTTATF